MASNTQTQLFGCPELAMKLKAVKIKRGKRYKYSSFREKKEVFKGNVVNLPVKLGKKFLFEELEAEVDFAKRSVAKSAIEKYIKIGDKNVLAAEHQSKNKLEK